MNSCSVHLVPCALYLVPLYSYFLKMSCRWCAFYQPDERVFEILRMWRKEKAKELDVPAFVVFSDRTLRHLAQLRPTRKEELIEVYGMGNAKIERFGPELLAGPLADC